MNNKELTQEDITELLKDRQPPMEIINLSESEDMEEYCFLHLRMKEGFDREDFYSRYGSYPETWYKKEIVILKDKNLYLTDKQLKYISSDEFRTFYRIARNYQTRSLNIDKSSCYWFGINQAI